MAQQLPIGDYAFLGDGHTGALVSREGSIDWLPWPDFDSPGLFSAILDGDRGGCFSVSCAGPGANRRRYLPRTNILETSFDTPDGAAVLVDFLAVDEDRSAAQTGIHPHRALVRLVRGVS